MNGSDARIAGESFTGRIQMTRKMIKVSNDPKAFQKVDPRGTYDGKKIIGIYWITEDPYFEPGVWVEVEDETKLSDR